MIKYGSAIQMVTGFTIGTEAELSKNTPDLNNLVGSPLDLNRRSENQNPP